MRQEEKLLLRVTPGVVPTTQDAHWQRRRGGIDDELDHVRRRSPPAATETVGVNRQNAQTRQRHEVLKKFGSF